MLYPKCDREILKEVIWAEGKVINILNTLYWMTVQVVCSSNGKQKAQFANGEFPFFEFIVAQSRTLFAGNTVPVLPDGRILMVLEHRGPNIHYPALPKTITRANVEDINLGSIGSLESPGGTIEKGEGIKSGLLRELAEETGLRGSTAVLYYRKHPTIVHNATVALGIIHSVIYLPEGADYERYVENDGGLHVFALTEEEIERNIAGGAISSGQAALLGWLLYKTVKGAGCNALVSHGDILREEVVLS